jgi:hypothetical protein
MNTILSLFPILSPVVPLGWLPVLAEPGCPDGGRSPAERVVCGVAGWSAWVAGLSGRLWQAAVSGWLWLLAAVVVVLLLVLVVRVAHRAAWRRAVAGGYWVRVVPPRQVDPGHAEDGWRLLAGLACAARRGWWRPAKPPLAFEVYQQGGRLTAGLWLPRWVPYPAVTAEAARVWPGARLDRTAPPTLTPYRRDRRGGWRVAGVRLRAARPDTGFLVDDTRTGTPGRGAFGADRLQAVYDALGKPDGPALLQVLVRPAPAGRLTALDRASRYPTRPRRNLSAVVLDGVAGLLLDAVRFVLDLITELVSTGRSTGRPRHSPSAGGDRSRRVDPVQGKAMREAAEKLAGGPHVLATVRVGAARPGLGFARAAASSIGYGFRTVARYLFPAQLGRASMLLEQRRARSGQWLLLSTAELAVLAHLPADPARHGFEVTALHRPWPGGASHADPEQPTHQAAGWTRDGWTGTTDPDGDPGEHHPLVDGSSADDDPPPMEAV